MMLRRTFVLIGIVLAAQFAAIRSQATVTGRPVASAVAGGQVHPMLAQGTLIDLNGGRAPFMRNQSAPGGFRFSVRSPRAFAVCSALAVWFLVCCVVFFRKPELWCPAVAMLANATNSRFAHELYIALMNREGSRAERKNGKGDTEFRRRRKKIYVYDYASFYNKAMKELSLYSTCEPARPKAVKPADKGLSQAAANPEIKKIIRSEVTEILSRQKDQNREQRSAFADAPIPQWQPQVGPFFYKQHDRQ